MLLYQKAAIEKFCQIIGGCRKFHGGEEERDGEEMRDGVFEQWWFFGTNLNVLKVAKEKDQITRFGSL